MAKGGDTKTMHKQQSGNLRLKITHKKKNKKKVKTEKKNKHKLLIRESLGGKLSSLTLCQLVITRHKQSNCKTVRMLTIKQTNTSTSDNILTQ